MKLITSDYKIAGISFHIWILILTLAAFVLRVFQLSSQPPSGDDIAVAVSSWNYMERGHLGPTMWNHPPLRNILVYLTLFTFGGGVWGLKSASVVLGTLSVPLLGLLTHRLFSRTDIAVLSALFLALDPLHIDYSRQAVHEVYMMFFYLAGIYCACGYIEKERPRLLILSGICFGLGMSSKWYVLFPLLTTFAFLVHSVLFQNESGAKKPVATVFFVFSSLILLPFITYLIVYLPWFQRGYDFPDWLLLQKLMYLKTKVHSGYNPYTSELVHNAVLWFMKPVAYADFIFSEGKPVVLIGIPNPAVWLLTVPSLVYLAYRAIKAGKSRYYFIFFTFIIAYAPLVVSSRPIWVHTAFSIIPFAFMAISYSIIKIAERRRIGNALVAAYLISIIITTIPLYALAIGKGLEYDNLKYFVEMYRPSHERKPQ